MESTEGGLDYNQGLGYANIAFGVLIALALLIIIIGAFIKTPEVMFAGVGMLGFGFVALAVKFLIADKLMKKNN